MSAELVELITAQGVFRPRGNFAQLAADHVPFDDLVGRARFESAALEAVANDDPVTVVGPRGGGKSSLIANVCARLPKTHVALRVPVTGADEPTSVSVVAAVALSQALADLEFEDHQASALEGARADETTRERTPGALTGLSVGGGPIPAQVQAELGSLREELRTDRLAAERLVGLERLVSILVARGVQPVFVLEDTEAAVGGADQAEVADAFLAGPVRAFVHEVQTPCLIAIQDAFTSSPAFAQVVAGTRLVEIPALDETRARGALRAIVANRLEQHEIFDDPASVVAAEALDQLIVFYDETDRNLRFTLAALQMAAEYAADVRSERIEAGHIRGAASEWRSRLSS